MAESDIPPSPSVEEPHDSDAAQCVECTSGEEAGIQLTVMQEHALGKCRACNWHRSKKGCVNGESCQFCHICSKAQGRQRKRQIRQILKAEARREQQLEESQSFHPNYIVISPQNELITSVESEMTPCVGGEIDDTPSKTSTNPDTSTCTSKSTAFRTDNKYLMGYLNPQDSLYYWYYVSPHGVPDHDRTTSTSKDLDEGVETSASSASSSADPTTSSETEFMTASIPQIGKMSWMDLPSTLPSISGGLGLKAASQTEIRVKSSLSADAKPFYPGTRL